MGRRKSEAVANRVKEIARMMASGMSRDEICRTLNIRKDLLKATIKEYDIRPDGTIGYPGGWAQCSASERWEAEKARAAATTGLANG